MERVKPDFSIRVSFTDSFAVVDRVYDQVHIFDWLGYSLLKLVTSEGFNQIPVTVEQGLEVAKNAGIIPTLRNEIAESEHEHYLKVMAMRLEDTYGQGTDI